MRTFFRFLGWTILVAAVVAGGVAAWFYNAVYRDRSFPVRETHVVIARGSTFDEIARQLAREGVIGNYAAFRSLARMRSEESGAHAGEYRFMAHQTQSDVLEALMTGGAQVAVWVTIPEGFTAQEIAARLQESGVGTAAPFASEFAHDSILVGGVRTRSLEGFLFPSTYLVSLGASARQVESQLTGEFLAKLPHDAAARAKKLGVTLPQAVTVASLVEREAKADADRPLIASVIYNRLRLRMPLQVDATIEYALPAHKNELSFADLRIDSPYNTYIHAGLPPTPIANPGLPSLEAALAPSKTDFLYYVYCGSGRHVFAKTLTVHQANVARCLH
ncbi:MAG TPA: endolytic transglycosylase MltG [Candidatus Baltobacteraceae bacterium]|nr:endolytic transglycosylase MltG [Candidatus Baltobacteraceae bacterium]